MAIAKPAFRYQGAYEFYEPLAPLRGFPITLSSNLGILRVYDSWIPSMTEAWRYPALTELVLPRCQLSSLDGIQHLHQLTRLVLLSNFLTSLAPLTVGTAELRELDFSENHISSLEPLASLSGLTNLTLRSNQVSCLQPLSRLRLLKLLSCPKNFIPSIAPLAELPGLAVLNISSNSISTIVGLNASLVRFAASNNYISSIEPLSRCTSLLEIEVCDNCIHSLEPLSGLTQLRQFVCHRNCLSSLQPLSALSLLDNVGISNCGALSLTALAHLPKLTTLVAQNNLFSSVAPLRTLRISDLYISYNPITSLDGLPACLNFLEAFCLPVRALLPFSKFRALDSVFCYDTDDGARELHASAPTAVQLGAGKRKIA